MIQCDKCGKQGTTEDVDVYKVAMIPASEPNFNHLDEFVASEVHLCGDCFDAVEDAIQDLLSNLKPSPRPKKGKKGPGE